MMNVLLIEDDRGIAAALSAAIAKDHRIVVARTASSGLEKANKFTFDVIILDLNLPDLSGLEVCSQLRTNGNLTPVLILTGEADVLSKIKLLDAGADDYLTKPFSLGELKARLRALGRHSPPVNQPEEIRLGDIVLDSGRHYVERQGQVVNLRRKEFAILECLLKQAGSVVSRTSLANYAWQAGDSPWTNTIDVHIKHLRDKFDRPFAEPLIRTVHGLGYKIELLAEPAELTES